MQTLSSRMSSIVKRSKDAKQFLILIELHDGCFGRIEFFVSFSEAVANRGRLKKRLTPSFVQVHKMHALTCSDLPKLINLLFMVQCEDRSLHGVRSGIGNDLHGIRGLLNLRREIENRAINIL